MPANLSPEYKEADQAYRRATTDEERLEALHAMLRTIPKHKGTEFAPWRPPSWLRHCVHQDLGTQSLGVQVRVESLGALLAVDEIYRASTISA
jgi:hypothetical protein